MRVVGCAFCGSDDSSLVYVLRDFQLGAPGEFRLVRCNECRLLYLHPQPSWDELVERYPDHYRSYTQSLDKSGGILKQWARRHGLRRRCRTVARLRSRGRLLDVGCATGSFLQEMGHFGEWELHGVEPVSSAATHARDEYGLSVLEGTLEEAGFPDEFFDVVTFWDVLEHIPHPKRSLLESYRILSPGGWLVAQVPDPECWHARLYGEYWIGYDAPRHLFGYPPGVLMHELSEMGYEGLTSRCLEGGTSSLLRSLAAWWSDKSGGDGGLLKAIVDQPVLRLPFAALSALLRLVGQGPSRTYFARKPASGGNGA
jgi:SAM-dependent methyltransferase